MARPIKVLFICTGNCCRSQMAEALLRAVGGDRFEVFSAGSEPAGFVHQLALETMRRMGISTRGQYSKSWEEFAGQPMDLIITVCDDAAGRVCAQWPGMPPTAHWGLPDPSFVLGSDEERLRMAAEVAHQIQRWLEVMVGLPLEQMTPDERRTAVQRIAQSK